MRMTSRLLVITASVVVAATAESQPLPGRFEGTIKTEWLPDGRDMRLLEDVTFVDGAGRRWTARKDARINGASIPQVFWGSGGPYEGKYRDASVIHDVFCAENPKTAPWRAVHRMFYEAMITSGVDRDRALVMYGAVYKFGPRWPPPFLPPVRKDPKGPPLPPTDLPPRAATEEDRLMLERLVKEGTISSPEDVEALGLN